MKQTAQTSITEKSRTLPVIENYDVIVVGGGMAGIAAAVSAARMSARVCLIEKYCAVGGLATLGNVTIWLPLCDGKGKQVIAGLAEELIALSTADISQENVTAHFVHIPDCWRHDASIVERAKKRYQAEFNPSSYMLALEKYVYDANVHIFYDTRVCSVVRGGARISHVICENKDGRVAIAGKTIIDATGDADICYLAGEKTVSLDSNVLAGWFYTFSLHSGTLKLHQFSHSYSRNGGKETAKPPFFCGDTATGVTRHIIQTREKIREKYARICAENPVDDIQLLTPPTMACFRMTRRLEATYTLSENDMHIWHDDTVGCTGDWRRKGPVYPIPLRILQGVQTKNLLCAGRCISADTSVWDVTRAIPACVVSGEAAGCVAALAAENERGNTHAVAYSIIHKQLNSQGVLLDIN